MRKTAIAAQYLPWLLLLLVMDGFSALLLWLSDARAFCTLVFVIVMSSLLLFAAVLRAVLFLEKGRKKAFFAFLDNPDEYHEELYLKAAGAAQADMVHALGATLREKQNEKNSLKTRVEDYEEYVESWAHAIKAPLFLLTLFLDNRREELLEETSFKLDYVRKCMQESVDQMLYYARVKGARKDYLFECIPVSDCVEEVLEDYRPLLLEKHFTIITEELKGTVYTDRRGFRFLVEQIVSNSVKYCDKEPKLLISLAEGEKSRVLSIRDNGIGVKSCDLPYIFEKGFTGDSGENRKRATGMGLYLAREIAGELGISLEAASVWGEGTEVRVLFPVVE